jgi:hypothetical protein
MRTLLDLPLLLLVVTFALQSLAANLAAFVRRRTVSLETADRDDLGIILAATLTLLGLILGFAFSMAISRYDLRKSYEEAEANAIGTEYARADLLPAADATAVRALLVEYLGQRIAYYNASEKPELASINSGTARLQTRLWNAVRTPALADPNPVAALVLAGMNDVLNSQGYAQAEWWNRIPHAGWLLMIVMAVSANGLIGFVAKSRRKGILLILPLIVALGFLLIADIDSPRGGLIRVVPQNLLSLAESLRPN